MTATAFRNCFACDFKEVTAGTACPKCGKPLQTESTIRVLGGVLAFLGFLVTAIMTWAVKAIGNSPRIDRPGHYGETMRDLAAENLAYYVLVAVFIMGASTILAGGWMLLTGRRNLKMLWFMIGFGLALGSVGYVFRNLLS